MNRTIPKILAVFIFSAVFFIAGTPKDAFAGGPHRGHKGYGTIYISSGYSGRYCPVGYHSRRGCDLCYRDRRHYQRYHCSHRAYDGKRGTKVRGKVVVVF